VLAKSYIAQDSTFLLSIRLSGATGFKYLSKETFLYPVGHVLVKRGQHGTLEDAGILKFIDNQRLSRCGSVGPLFAGKKRGNMCVLKWLFVPLMKLFVSEAKGFENVPRTGRVILVANHASYIDALLVRYFTDWHRGRAPIGIQSAEWLGTSWFKRFIFVTLLGQIPTNGSVAKALASLAKGNALMIFPEGGRSADGKMRKATHTGLGVLASNSNAAVIPVGIEGSFEWWPRQKSLPTFALRKMAIRVGKPVRYSGKPTKQNHLDFQNKVMRAVAKLARKRYPA
jgi:1-acyl-sn-glycerol-3-phosphate acyltransferase